MSTLTSRVSNVYRVNTFPLDHHSSSREAWLLEEKVGLIGDENNNPPAVNIIPPHIKENKEDFIDLCIQAPQSDPFL